ncbi:MAG: exodeoxyribonuclease VII large subunit [Clostridia bacterium]|nr:exodeoxyribonuclease VII large subunit [Clostridia bacterium]
MAWTLTVTQLNEYVSRSLAGDPALRFLSLRGEISDLKKYASGHWYFILKDENSRIQCVCFRQKNMLISFPVENGMKVVLTGAVGLYTASGSYQFYADTMSLDGMGELYLKYEAMKARLMKEGLFDVSRKKPLPLLPRMIGVVTSRSGAVIHDIATVTRRRYPGMQLVLRPCLVQGENAAPDIAAGIAEISRVPGIDVIIVGRGGGSMEDLWAFNEEIVVRAIAACPIPIVSAVGHEVDVTLSDLAADERAATPTEAAEKCVPEYRAVVQAIEKYKNALLRAGQTHLLRQKALLSALENRLNREHPALRLKKARGQAELYTARLQMLLEKKLSLKKADIQRLTEKMNALGPRQALQRGYAFVLAGGKPVTSVDDAQEKMTLVMQDGTINVHVDSIRKEDPFGEEAAIL